MALKLSVIGDLAPIYYISSTGLCGTYGSEITCTALHATALVDGTALAGNSFDLQITNYSSLTGENLTIAGHYVSTEVGSLSQLNFN